MAKVRFHSEFDMSAEGVNQFLDGDISLAEFSSTRVVVNNGDYSATLTGEGFGYDFSTGGPTGTVYTLTAAFQDNPVISITNLNVPAAQLWEDRADADALANDLFGGKDAFAGSKGADVIYAFDGADKIDGNKGADLLFGGAGRDTFIYNSASDSSRGAPDMIGDLSADDTIDLSGLGITADDLKVRFDSLVGPNGVTSFLINLDDDAKAEMIIMADGDHRGFEGVLFEVG